jgi:hypothetical protein
MRLANSHSQKAVLLASLLLYIGSLLCPAVEYDTMSSQPAVRSTHLWHEPLGRVERVPGYFHLALGWVGMLVPPQITPLGWLANPCYFLALLFARWRRIILARSLAGLSLLLAATSLLLVNLSPLRVMLHDPVPQFWSAIAPLAGFWLWLAAIAALNIYEFTLSRPASGSVELAVRQENSAARSRTETGVSCGTRAAPARGCARDLSRRTPA